MDDEKSVKIYVCLELKYFVNPQIILDIVKHNFDPDEQGMLVEELIAYGKRSSKSKKSTVKKRFYRFYDSIDLRFEKLTPKTGQIKTLQTI